MSEYTVPLVLGKPGAGRLPARTSLELPAGVLSAESRLVVRGRGGRPLLSQTRTLIRWPGGSARWVHLVFEPGDADTEVVVAVAAAAEPAPGETPLATQDGADVVVDTGAIAFRLETPDPNPDRRLGGVLTGVRHGTRPVTRRSPDAGLVATESDGRVYSSQKAGPRHHPLRWDAVLSPEPPLPSYGIRIVESGPVRALLRVEGRTAFDAYRGGLDYRIYVEVYRARSIARLSIAWIHRDGQEAHFVSDLRFRIPLAFRAARAIFGTPRGEMALEVRPGARYSLLQAEHDVFRASRREWDGRVFDLASGGANGVCAPGWLWLGEVEGPGVGLWVPGFQVEHPNEILFDGETLEIGLWPAAASRHFHRLPVLQPLVDGNPENRHRKLVYECLTHHPYRSFWEPELECLETVKGMQKTQEIVLDLAAPPASDWQRLAENGELDAPWARVRAGAASADPDVQAGEAVLDRAAKWLTRYPEVHGVHGKFDHGDLFYLVHREMDDTAWRGALEEHPRSGYWNNNEEDPVHGLYRHAARTGDPEAAAAARVMARHLWDVDVRHHPPWGVHTHTEGHCFRSQAWTATDHFWLEGLVDHAVSSALPDVLEGVAEVAAVAAKELGSVRPAESDLRTVSLAIAQYVRCGEALGDVGFVHSARELAHQQAADLHPDGYFTDYGSATGRARSPSLLFGTLFVEALVEVDGHLPDEGLRRAALRQVDWFLRHALLPGGVSAFDPADTWGKRGEAARPTSEDIVGAFQLLGNLAAAHRWTGDPKYLATGRTLLRRLVALQGPDGDWLTGGILWQGETPILVDPRPVTRGQVRPLGPSTALRCLPGFLDTLRSARAG